jgi:7-cyano-7-deazaguanine reductase
MEKKMTFNYFYGTEADQFSFYRIPKSLKLYLFSFRNHGDFHEDCMNIIMKDLIKLMDPKYIEVWGKFTPRGGISIDPYCNY